MNNYCPACGARFDREPGYFTGAIYIGAILALPMGAALFYLSARLFPDLDLAICGLIGAVGFIPFVPLTLRLSRVLWLDFGMRFSPADPSSEHPPPPPSQPLSPADPPPLPDRMRGPSGGETDGVAVESRTSVVSLIER